MAKVKSLQRQISSHAAESEAVRSDASRLEAPPEETSLHLSDSHAAFTLVESECDQNKRQLMLCHGNVSRQYLLKSEVISLIICFFSVPLSEYLI